ncbi:hypothetical protein H4696_003078 [Amycolatopsis lexingtonensis]|uniref:Uncharacterized protein n=1 Tax=Amycolatopsis lexingtonensis TaxID=218822 RepID=A0ABR9HYG8_9PSEU|nr:hypothetical protein [Amycolatopsis lexingtonensis]MBE1495978.1 hypothetical protein [Amycolatopsis lexingtonensis]
MNDVDTHGGSVRRPATPIFDRLLAEAGLSWVDAVPAASGEQSELPHSNGWFCTDEAKAEPPSGHP